MEDCSYEEYRAIVFRSISERHPEFESLFESDPARLYGCRRALLERRVWNQLNQMAADREEIARRRAARRDTDRRRRRLQTEGTVRALFSELMMGWAPSESNQFCSLFAEFLRDDLFCYAEMLFADAATPIHRRVRNLVEHSLDIVELVRMDRWPSAVGQLEYPESEARIVRDHLGATRVFYKDIIEQELWRRALDNTGDFLDTDSGAKTRLLSRLRWDWFKGRFGNVQLTTFCRGVGGRPPRYLNGRRVERNTPGASSPPSYPTMKSWLDGSSSRKLRNIHASLAGCAGVRIDELDGLTEMAERLLHSRCSLR